ncbi:hypothetical protein HPB50_016992 [Hyalomma asiaticum]|uniref:Uncharacterized protein n=1 Tax=Hyalomma asiaticum TaxID=266040 RepID=A0ACB7S048_HYAAI|nr:hypothetical protein HPB50_016992 [Hyalomma asiaticum]
MFAPARQGLTAEELKETEHSVPPPSYPELLPGFSPKCSDNSEEDKHMACALNEQRRKFVESAFNIPPLKKPRFDDKYHRQVHTPPAVNYDSSYFPAELKVSKKARRARKSSETSVAQIDIEIETELKTPEEQETKCESDAQEGEETSQKSSEDDSDDEDEEESLDEEEMDEAMDYIHNYYDDYEDDGAFNEDNIDDGFAY